MNKHTPTPWNTNLHDGQVFCNGGMLLANCNSSLRGRETIKENSEFVCLAVNNHQSLVDALTDMCSNFLPTKDTDGNFYQNELEAYNKAKLVLHNLK